MCGLPANGSARGQTVVEQVAGSHRERGGGGNVDARTLVTSQSHAVDEQDLVSGIQAEPRGQVQVSLGSDFSNERLGPTSRTG